MKRIDGNFGPRDVEEEKRRSRDAVLGSFLLFGIMIATIKIGNTNFPLFASLL